MTTRIEQELAARLKREQKSGRLTRKDYLPAFMAARSNVMEAMAAAGPEPPPHRRHGLRTLGQLDNLHIEGEAQRPAQVPTTSAPKPSRVQKSAPSELEQREARIRAQMEAKRARRQGRKGRGA